jgi:transketolase
MPLAKLRQFQTDRLTERQVALLAALAGSARADALEMITAAGSGHPGGALSSLDLYLMLWLCAAVSPTSIAAPARDRLVVSHGHTVAGLYAVLGNLGYFDLEDCQAQFRRDGGIFEGHPSLAVPGVEWCSGSLGQGLSVGAGFALAARLRRLAYQVFVVMGDGEQAKGQLQEAREFAVKYNLNNLTAIIDCNGLQASGTLPEIMPQAIADKYRAAGWRVLEIDGHDYREIYRALRVCALEDAGPTAILARTVMGKGVPGIEHQYAYHGKPLTREQLNAALPVLRGAGAPTYAIAQEAVSAPGALPDPIAAHVLPGAPRVYPAERPVECRTAFGNALHELAVANAGHPEVVIAAVDCDLLESVRLHTFARAFPEQLIECGIQEHNAATVAAALSAAGVLTFFADFGVFGLDETYGQHRMSDLNHTALKLICTHCGLDVGEDGKTHQCVDALGLLLNLWGVKILLPADVNQTDRMIRYAATTPGNIAVLMGRSALPVLTDEQGAILYGPDRPFAYGDADWVRRGEDGTIITCGSMVWRAVQAHETLTAQGWQVGVLNLCCPAQVDEEAVRQAAATGLIVTYEDHNIRTGIGSLIGAFLAEQGLSCRFRRLGVSRYGHSASPAHQYQAQGLDAHRLARTLAELLAGEPTPQDSALA